MALTTSYIVFGLPNLNLNFFLKPYFHAMFDAQLNQVGDWKTDNRFNGIPSTTDDVDDEEKPSEYIIQK